MSYSTERAVYELDDSEQQELDIFEMLIKGAGISHRVIMTEDGVVFEVTSKHDVQKVYDLDPEGELVDFPYFVETITELKD